jgi:dimethylargininase
VLSAITRAVSRSIDRCELTHLARTPIDPVLVRQQHDRYERSLSDAGCAVRRLPADESMPDAVFVEDVAIVFDEVAVIARPGAESRRGETPAVVDALENLRPIARIADPATLDGGDVLVVGRDVFVGRSRRTNHAGIDQLRQILMPWKYSVRAMDVTRCLHLKSAVTCVGDGLVLINPEWVRSDAFAGLGCISVDPSEPSAANALRIGNRLIYPEAFTRTRRLLERHGLYVRAVDVSELAKAEGGVTCCSLVFNSKTPGDTTDAA